MQDNWIIKKKILLDNHSLCIDYVNCGKYVHNIGMLAFAICSKYLCLDTQLDEQFKYNKALKLFAFEMT